MALADVTATTAVADSGPVLAQPCCNRRCKHESRYYCAPNRSRRPGCALICPFTHPNWSRIAHVCGALNPHNRLSSRPAASFNPAWAASRSCLWRASSSATQLNP